MLVADRFQMVPYDRFSGRDPIHIDDCNLCLSPIFCYNCHCWWCWCHRGLTNTIYYMESCSEAPESGAIIGSYWIVVYDFPCDIRLPLALCIQDSLSEEAQNENDFKSTQTDTVPHLRRPHTDATQTWFNTALLLERKTRAGWLDWQNDVEPPSVLDEIRG